jgi:RimJ/RimL family protein N-acetyltransferase
LPFSNLWTDRRGAAFDRGFAQYLWRQRARWSPESWTLPFAVRWNGRPVGIQQIEAQDFAVLRTVSTGSWLGRRYQGHGLGTEMRAAVLAFAFAGLRADAAVSGAYSYNAASIRVSEKLGYARNGVRADNVRGASAEAVLFRLTREAWFGAARPAVDIDGLAGCSELFGVGGREPHLVSVSG